MCTDCGCAKTQKTKTMISTHQNLMAANQAQADRNRTFFDQNQVTVINVMSSPGAGKTTLLEATAQALPTDWRMAVIEGDLQTENDARRLRRHGVKAIQITTGNACHLDADMVSSALVQLDFNNLDMLFIENVGNLVCPASFDLGQHLNAVMLSVTEGEDKPIKYPPIFHAADVMLLGKTDLLPHLPDFSGQRASDYFRRVNGHAPVIPVSATQGQIDDWLQFLRATHTRLYEQTA